MSLAILAGSSLLLAVSAYHASKRTKPGFLRAAIMLPMAVAYFALPALTVDGREEVLLAQTLCCILSMSAFKLVALSAGRGCLADKSMDCWTFLGVCLLPVIPISISTKSEDLPKRIAVTRAKLRSGLTKLAVFLLLAAGSLAGFHAVERVRQQQQPPPSPSSFSPFSLSCWATVLPASLTVVQVLSYFFAGVALMHQVDGLGDLVDAAALRLWGVTAEPHFNQVHKATSFAELWGRRWNITVTSVLRAAVYLPVVEGRWVAAADDDPRVGDPPPPPSPATSLHRHRDVDRPESKGGNASREETVRTADATAAAAEVAAGAAEVPDTPFKTPPKQPQQSQPQPLLDAPASPASMIGWAATSPAASPASSAASRGSTRAPLPDGTASGTSSTSSGASSNAAGDIPHQELQPKPSVSPPTQHPHPHSQQRPNRPRSRPSTGRRFLGCLLAFLVSGLWHELVCFTMTRSTSGGWWLMFFVLQAPLLLVESHVVEAARAVGLVAPPRAACLITHGLLLLQLTLMWYPPMVSTGMMASVTRKADETAALLKSAVQQVYGNLM